MRQIGRADLNDPVREPVGVSRLRRQEFGEAGDYGGQLGHPTVPHVRLTLQAVAVAPQGRRRWQLRALEGAEVQVLLAGICACGEPHVRADRGSQNRGRPEPLPRRRLRRLVPRSARLHLSCRHHRIAVGWTVRARFALTRSVVSTLALPPSMGWSPRGRNLGGPPHTSMEGCSRPWCSSEGSPSPARPPFVAPYRSFFRNSRTPPIVVATPARICKEPASNEYQPSS